MVLLEPLAREYSFSIALLLELMLSRTYHNLNYLIISLLTFYCCAGIEKEGEEQQARLG
jgi:hypothetical protein